jgi:hypothetical protein
MEVVVTSVAGRGGARGCPQQTGRYARTAVRGRDLPEGAARSYNSWPAGGGARHGRGWGRTIWPQVVLRSSKIREELNPLDIKSLLGGVSLLSVISRRAGGRGGAVVVARGRRWVARRWPFFFRRKP